MGLTCRYRWPGASCLLVMLMLMATACERPPSSAAERFVTRDSAGITIVENGPTASESVAWWSVDTAPAVTIGALSGDPALEFSVIGRVAQLPNGMIVVIDGRGEAAFEFRFFDSTGRHVATHGRQGDGPGEYRWVSYFGSAGGDTLIAVDFPSRRLNWLSASKGYLRSIRLDEERFRQLLGADARGTSEALVPIGDSVYAIAAYRQAPDARSLADRARSYHIVDLRSGIAITQGRLDEARGTPITLSAGPATAFPIEPSMPMHVVDRTRRRICAAQTGASEIRCMDDKDRRTIIRWAADPVPYTAADRKAREELMRRTFAQTRRYTEADIGAYLAAVEWPERFNPFSVLQLDADGNFWILEPSRDASGTVHRRFRILDPNGRLIAFADSFPVRPSGIGARTFIGAAAVVRAFEDAEGVPKVGVFRIRRP